MYVTTTMYVIMCILKKTKEAYATKSNKTNFLQSVVNFLKRKGKNMIFLGQLFSDLKNL
jgi:exo-beta-1,3-glucanase (GH17 family)